MTIRRPVAPPVDVGELPPAAYEAYKANGVLAPTCFYKDLRG